VTTHGRRLGGGIALALLAGCSLVPDDETATTSPTPAVGREPVVLDVVEGPARRDGRTGDGGTATGDEPQRAVPRWVQLRAATIPTLEDPYVVDIHGATLYRSDEDANEPSMSRCTDECATTWLPVTMRDHGTVYVAGVARDRISAIVRQDDSLQLTIDGWPLYRYVRDEEPGETRGQGVDDAWFAVGITGERVE
jgi:predicted lipoprotein with Yx(FWY)xxD motif